MSTYVIINNLSYLFAKTTKHTHMGCCSGSTTDVAKMTVAKNKEDNTLTDKRKDMLRESWKKAMRLG